MTSRGSLIHSFESFEAKSNAHDLPVRFGEVANLDAEGRERISERDGFGDQLIVRSWPARLHEHAMRVRVEGVAELGSRLAESPHVHDPIRLRRTRRQPNAGGLCGSIQIVVAQAKRLDVIQFAHVTSLTQGDRERTFGNANGQVGRYANGTMSGDSQLSLKPLSLRHKC
jgi:hypothetical protein